MKCVGQEKKIVLFGTIQSLNKSVSDVHIVNLKNYSGTISNNNGEFTITVSLNDTLLISSIEYEVKKIRITEKHLKLKKIEIELIPIVNYLEEVFIKKITGNLDFDIENTPKDTLPHHNFVFKLSELDKQLPTDTHGFLDAPNVNPFSMGGGGSATIPDYYMISVRKLKREISQKIAFPIKIKKELGILFFTNNLKIPEGKIDHFLAYCESRDIIEKYYDNKLLEVIEILIEESESYQNIKNE